MKNAFYFCLILLTIGCNGQVNSIKDSLSICQLKKVESAVMAFSLPNGKAETFSNQEIESIIVDSLQRLFDLRKVKKWELLLTDFGNNYFFFEMNIFDQLCIHNVCICGFLKKNESFACTLLSVNSFKDNFRIESEKESLTVYKKICNLDCKSSHYNTVALVFYKERRKMFIYADDGLTNW